MKYDIVTLIEIGATDVSHANITNIVSFADRIVSLDGSMLDPLSVINAWNPGGVHQNHTYWEMELVLDTNWKVITTSPGVGYWEYFEMVDNALTMPALRDANYNPSIEYFVVTIREHDGTITTLTYADGTVDTARPNLVWLVGKTVDIDNEKGTRHQTTTFRFICFGDREKTHVPP